MKQCTQPKHQCRRRTIPESYETPDHGFTGIPLFQLWTRYLVERGAPEAVVAESRRQLFDALLSGINDGTLSAQFAADEADSSIAMGMELCDPASLVAHRRLLDLDGDRPKAEIEEADDRLNAMREVLRAKLVRCSARDRSRLEYELALVLACQARSANDSETELDLIRQSINLTHERNRDAWLIYLWLLLSVLLRRGQFELVRALREYLAKHGSGGDVCDLYLSRKLWRFTGRSPLR